MVGTSRASAKETVPELWLPPLISMLLVTIAYIPLGQVESVLALVGELWE
jgi:hypothetical protein